jgi:hypothetical protein
MNRGDIEFEVGKALKTMVNTDVKVTFSYALVPSKSKSDGGLGAGWNAWRILLNNVVNHHLPKKHPYSKLKIDVMLVDESHTKDLRSARYGLTQRLVLIDEHKIP